MGNSASDAVKSDVATRELCKEAIKGANQSMDAEQMVLSKFKAWDKDGNGKISVNELGQALVDCGMDVSDDDMRKLLKLADLNNDRVLDTQEFVAWLFKTPDLEKYFAEQNKLVADLQRDAQKIANKLQEAVIKAMDGSTAGKEKLAELKAELKILQEKAQAKYENVLTPIIKKAFKHHDKLQNGVLEPEESIIFFANFAAEFNKAAEGTIEASTIQAMKATGIPNDAASLKKLKTALSGMIQDLVDQYKADIGSCQKAAFSVIDINNDGKLQESELIAALIPGAPKNIEFMKAIRLWIDPAQAMAVGMRASLEDDKKADKGLESSHNTYDVSCHIS